MRSLNVSQNNNKTSLELFSYAKYSFSGSFFPSFPFLRNIQLALCHYAIIGNRREQFSKNPHEIIFDKRVKRLLDWIGAAAG